MNSPIPDDWISAWLDGELSAEERRRFEAELEEDDELRQRVEAYQRLGERLRQLPTHRLPASFASEVVARSAGTEKSSANRGLSANGRVNPQVAEISPTAPIPRSRSWYVAMTAIASLAAVVALAMAFPLWYPAAESQLSLLDEQVASDRVEIKSAAEAAPMPMASMPGMNAPESVESGRRLRGAAGEPNRGLEFGEGGNSISAMGSDEARDEAPALFGAAGRPGEPGVRASRGGAAAMRQPSDAANGPDIASLNAFSDPGVQGGLGGAGGLGLQGGAGNQSIRDFQGGRPLDPRDASDRAMNWDQIAADAAGAIIGQAVDRAMRREAPAEAKIVEPAAAPAVASATGGAPVTGGGAESEGSGAAAGGEAGGELALPGTPLARTDLPLAGGVGEAPVDELAAAGDEAMAKEEELEVEEAVPLTGENPVSETGVNLIPIAILALVDSPDVLAFVGEQGELKEDNEPGTLAELSWAADGPEGPIVSVGLASRAETEQNTEAAGHEATDLITNEPGAADDTQGALGLRADSPASTELSHRGEPAAVLQVRVFEIVDSPERVQAMAQRLSALAPRAWELQWGEGQSAWAKRRFESSIDLQETVGLADEEKVVRFRGRELSGEEAFSLIGWWLDATKPTELPWRLQDMEPQARSNDSQLATRYLMTLPQPELLAEEQRIAAADAAGTEQAPEEGMQQMTLWLVVPVNQPVDAESGDGSTQPGEPSGDSEIRASSEGSETVPVSSDQPAEVPSGQGEGGVPRDPMPLPHDPTVPEPDAPTPRPRADGEPNAEPSVEPMPEPTPEPMTDDPGNPSDEPSPMSDPNPLPAPSDPPSVDPPKSKLSVPGETQQRSEMTQQRSEMTLQRSEMTL